MNENRHCTLALMKLNVEYVHMWYSGDIWSHYFTHIGKVQLFWEGHKSVRNRPDGFVIYLKPNYFKKQQKLVITFPYLR